MENDPVPSVDLEAPLPVANIAPVDSVMIKAKKDWYRGITVFSIFLIVLAGVGWAYAKSQISSSQNTNDKIEIAIEEPKESPKPVESIKPVFAVWNGSGVPGAAGQMAAKLEGLGYKVVDTKNAPEKQTGTTLELSRDLASQSQKIEEVIGEKNITVKIGLESGLEYNALIILGQ